MKGQQVLFLCTGNFYRSRFAEEWFNYLCVTDGKAHRADSRALAIERGATCNFGPIAPHTRTALAARGVVLAAECRYPRQAADADFEVADLVIALKEAEHRPLMEQRYPRHAHRVEYWHVHDLDAATPEQAIPEIDDLVRELVRKLK